MSLESKTSWILRVDAAISWIVALPGLVDPVYVSAFLWPEEPTYSFLVRLWSGLLFLFGWLSWDASRSARAKATLLKYVWIEKAFVASTVLIGHLSQEAPPSLMGMVMLTNLPWVPVLLYLDLALRKQARLGQPKFNVAL